MKILLVYREYLNDNLFVQILRDGLRTKGCEVECSTYAFWNSQEKYDIVHIQWPEELFEWKGISYEDIDRLKKRIDYWKNIGSKIFYTRHNIVPHNGDQNIINVYRLIETHADGIIHLGKYSLDEMYKSTLNVNAQNFVIPHHIYENTYDEDISKEEARNKLNIPKDEFVITAFGKFRNKEESKMVVKAFLSYRNKKKYLLAPRILTFSRKGSFGRTLLYDFVHWGMMLLKINSGTYDEVIDNSKLPYYIIASDVLFVQRIKILNSGNIPLAFLFKKVVIGPEEGNLTELLRNTNNPTFNPQDNSSIVKALAESFALTKQHHGQDNYKYALQNMNIDRVSSMYVDAYTTVLNKL